MGPGKRKSRVIMIKCTLHASGRMAFIAGYTVKSIASDTGMFAVHIGLVVFMAINAAEELVVALVCMTLTAQAPCALVFPGIDREILPVVIECGGCPGRCAMARFAVGAELSCSMRRIAGLIVCIQVAADTGVWRSSVIAFVALIARYRCMCTI